MLFRSLQQLLWWWKSTLTRPTHLDSRMQGQGGSAGGVGALADYTAADPDEVPQQGKPDTAYRGCEQAGLPCSQLECNLERKQGMKIA